MYENHYNSLCASIGETVTIFTASGGQSGRGFTGVVISVNECYCRLLTSRGSSPDCALGNSCDNDDCCCEKNEQCCGSRLGSVTDIPIDKIVAFVHNAV